MHSSPVRSSLTSFDDTPHARRRHVVLSGTGAEGSSDSDSGGAGVVGLVGCAEDVYGIRGTAGVVVVSVLAFPTATVFADLSGIVVGSMSCFGGGAGVSSTVECLPVVHGGIVKNSSKVSTRGLQHFQPGI